MGKQPQRTRSSRHNITACINITLRSKPRCLVNISCAAGGRANECVPCVYGGCRQNRTEQVRAQCRYTGDTWPRRCNHLTQPAHLCCSQQPRQLVDNESRHRTKCHLHFCKLVLSTYQTKSSLLHNCNN